MRPVLIVDDEIPSRELIKMSLDWLALGYGPLLEARNGQEALALFKEHRPYLVITDIQMPVMDGLEFIRAIRGFDPAARVAILSCHESFSYAKEALRLGVMDYLIKDQVTSDSLVNLLSVAERWRPQAEPPAQEPTALWQALNAGASCEEAPVRFEDAPGAQRCFFVCAIRLESAVSAEFQLSLTRALAPAIPGVAVEISADVLYMLCPVERCVSMTRQLRDRAEAAMTAREAFARLAGYEPTMGVSRVKAQFASLNEAVEEARHAMNSFVFLGKRRNLYYEDACRQADHGQLQVLNQSIDAIRHALASRDGSLVQALVQRLYHKELCGMLQYNYLRHINAVLLGILTHACEQNQLPFRRVFGTELLSLEALDKMDTIGEICAWYQARFDALVSALQVDYGPRLSGILRYMERHFCDDISLDSVARTFGMNKAYLAKVFKAQTGLSVNEYIRSLRMERAKVLLDRPDARVGEVGDELGFHNPQTFYNLFKRHTGLSPSEYKERCDIRRVQSTLRQKEDHA